MKRNGLSPLHLLLLIVILILINIIGMNWFTRIDLTEDRVYSLSRASIDLVRNLEDPVTIRAYFTAQLPPPYSSYRRFVKDKLDEYRAYGGVNIQYEFIDPNQDEQARQEAERLGIPPVQIQVIENDNLQIKNVYMGLSIEYGGEREIIPVIEDLSTLEYDITSALFKLTRDRLPTVGILQGHGEPVPDQAFPRFKQALTRNYDVQTVRIENGALQPQPDVLFVIAPTDSFPEADLQALDTYITHNGKVAFLLNRVHANLQVGWATLQTTGLEPLLAHYGATVQPDLVMDRHSSVVSVQRMQGPFRIVQQIPYPFLPIATIFNLEHPMVNRLREVLFYFVSSIDTSQPPPTGVTREPLIWSSPYSQVQEEPFFIQPQMFRQELTFDKGPYVLAAALQGAVPSYFDSTRVASSARLVVVGDGDFINESIVGALDGNIEFGLNMADWLAQDEGLLAIRTKKIAPRQLEPIDDRLKPVIKYTLMLFPPLLVILVGLVRWRFRRNRKTVLA